MMSVGKKFIESKRANTKLLGYLHGSTSQINAICSQSTPPLSNFSPKFWPIPHWSHLELCDNEVIEGMEQLRCQVLAKKMTKYHELDGKSFSTEHF